MSAPDLNDPAADAFDRLRSEVALLRRAIEGLAANQPEAPADYTPSLAHLTKQAETMGASLEALAQSPYLAFSPEVLAAQIQSIIQRTRQEVAGEFRQAIDGLGRATATVSASVGLVRDRDAQRRWLAYAAAIGGVAVLALWLLLSGPAARALPRSWQVPERLAAATIGAPRWDAGARMMQGADPQRWRWVAFGDELVRRNRVAVQGCVSRAEKSGRAATCELRLDPTD